MIGRALRSVAIVTMLSLASLAAGAPAFAAVQLENSSPANGQVLAVPPTTVSLTFSETVVSDGSSISVSDGNGTDWVSGGALVNQTVVNAQLKTNMPNGVYTMDWQVATADGHTLRASIVFGIGLSDEVKDQVATGAAAVAPPVLDGGAITPPTPSSTPSEPAGSAGRSQSGTSAATILAMGGAGVLAAFALFVGVILIIRRNQVSVEAAADAAASPDQEPGPDQDQHPGPTSDPDAGPGSDPGSGPIADPDASPGSSSDPGPDSNPPRPNSAEL